MKNEKELKAKELKGKALAALTECRGNGNGYSLKAIQAIADMASADVWPDWRFSDEECNLWSTYHRFFDR